MKRQEMIDRIWDLDESDLLDVWCDYCEANRMWEDIISPNDEFFLENYSQMEVAQKVANGEWLYSDDYVKVDGYGNFVSFSYKSEIMEHIDIDPFVDWLIDNEIDF